LPVRPGARYTPATLAMRRLAGRGPGVVSRQHALRRLESGDGVIGALAAVGLRAAGNDGRLTMLGRIRELDGVQTVSALLAAGPIARVCDAAGTPLPPEAAVETAGKVRPWLRGGGAGTGGGACGRRDVAARAQGGVSMTIGRRIETTSAVLVIILLLVAGLALVAAGPAAAAQKENLATFEVRVDGKAKKTWTRAQIRKLPQAEFTNRQGKKRTAVLLSTLLEKSGVAMDRVATVTVSGLGGDTEKGPQSKGVQGEKKAGQTAREFKGDDVGAALARTVVFHNADQRWTLADLEGAGRGAPWDQNRVRKVRQIDVTLK
jgi:hypothetical protein